MNLSKIISLVLGLVLNLFVSIKVNAMVIFPTKTPQKNETIIPCGKNEIKILEDTLEELLSKKGFQNLILEDKICSIYDSDKYILRIRLSTFLSNTMKKTYTHIILWELGNGKISIKIE